ncbi:MAG: sodium:proton antiporter [Cytophagales bacterium]|nr:sodium:proton antiporter [Cytophagales bacterium]
MNLLARILLFSSLAIVSFIGSAQDDSHQEESGQTEVGHEVAEEEHHGEGPAGWSVLPFAILLLMIATGPLFYEHFWHKNYPKVAVGLTAFIVVYYLFFLHNQHSPVHALAEYVQFIALLTGLYVASGGIMIIVDKDASPLTNIIILALGAVIANVIGTTGASMLLIRPFIRLNRNRIKAYHIIFFIFIVSNIGGSLTPIGDPPLFLGFLKGIPFLWTMQHNVVPWGFAIVVLLGVFYVFDRSNKSDYSFGEDTTVPTGRVGIRGTRNFVWLAVVVGAVFLDPNVFDWVPGIEYEGQTFSYLREIIMLAAAYLSYKLADQQALLGNDFNFEPIREVAFIFIGIFGTMMPALELVSNFAQSPVGVEMISANSLYWGTGLLSGFLDNAPTYVNFLTASMAASGGDVNSLSDVQAFAADEYTNSAIYLKAISIAAVFFGAMTYIGNGPNFMVKSIAEQVGIKMPSFFGYIIRFSVPFLIPLFIIVWLIFFYWA